MNCCVLIPVYNNHSTIERVVREAMQYCNHVIVVNDGSNDGTEEILRGIKNIDLISYPDNRGKGYAIKIGMQRAKASGFNNCITMDADGQHYAQEIPKFLAESERHPGALIIGERNLNGVDRSKSSAFANKFSNFWFAVQTGRFLKDTQTGYRLYPLDHLPHLDLISNRYEAELALLVFAAWRGVELIGIPIEVYYPPRHERVSHFNPTNDFARISLLNTILCVLAVIYGFPRLIIRWILNILRTAYTLIMFSLIMFIGVLPFTWLYIKCTNDTEKRKITLHRLIQKFAHFSMEIHGIPGVRFTKSVDPNINLDQPQVIISNHQSHLDLLPILLLHPKIVFLTNNWAYHNPFYGLLIRNAEFLSTTNGIDSIMPKVHNLVQRGYSIALFPEGTRSADCTIGRFHSGAFYLAEQLDLPITPIILQGPGLVLPKKSYYLRRGKISMQVCSSWSRSYLNNIGDLLSQRKFARRWYIEKLRANNQN